LHTERKPAVECADLFDKCFNFTTSHDVKKLGIYPYFHPIQSAPGNEVRVDGKHCIMVGSNNYLGLVDHPEVKRAAAEAAQKYGSGCTGSRFLNGTLDLHLELEDRLAKFLKKDRALVFSTGFQTNMGTISCLVGKNDTIVIDRQDHACIVDGCRLSHGKTFKFAHNNMEDLERVLAMVTSLNSRGGILIVVDGVFSMEGDIAKLPAICELAQRFDARVMVDDAHAIGVLGEHGSGTAEHFGLGDRVDLITGTFSKSFAALGGFVAGDDAVIEYIQHHSRALIFSASITPSSAAAVLAALDIIEREPERRDNLWKNARRILREFKALGLDTHHAETPIVPIVVGDDLDCFAFWKNLFDNGVFTNPVVSPAVPPGRAMIRTSYTATHTDKQLDRVVEVVAKVARERGLIS
jgi:8-amino-7-oxononanoate synthase